jgi:hypothetical protein
MPLTITGEYLNNTSFVRFGGTDASFVLANGSLLVTVPDSSGNVSVTVTDRYTNVTTIPFVYKNPLLQSLNPSAGPQRRTLEILGQHLSNTSVVKVGRYNVSFDQIEGGLRVKVPDQEGEVSVQVTDRYGNNVSAKYIYRNPKLSQVNPSISRTGREVTLEG